MRRPGTMFLRGLLALVFVAAYSPGALLPVMRMQAPPRQRQRQRRDPRQGVERVTSVEGITEYRLAERPARAAVPGPVEADDHGQHHLPRRLAPRELRRDRHGAPARAPGVQGHAAATEHPAGADRARRAPERHTWFDRTNYFETFPATDENLEWALDLEADRMVNSFIAKKDLDSEMTVVRNEFEMRREQSRQRAARARCCRRRISGTTTASRRSARASDIENVPIDRLQAFYKQLLPARQRGRCSSPASSTRRRRSRSSTKYFGPIPKPTRTLPAHLHARADAGRRARGHAAPRRRRAVRRGRRTTCRAGRTRTSRRSTCSAQILGDTPVGPAVQGAGRDQEGSQRRSAVRLPAARSRASLMFVAEVRAGSVARRRARRAARRPSKPSWPAPITEEEVERARAAAPEEHRAAAELVRTRRPAAQRVDRRWATGGCSSCTATACAQVTRRRRAAGRGDVLQAGQPHGRRVHPDREARSRRDSRRRRTSPRWSRTTRATPRSPPARRSTPRRRTSRRARSARASGRHEAGAAAEEDARRHGRRRRSTLPFRRREEPRGQAPSRLTSPAAMLMRGTHEAHAPADSGRARPAEGAHERRAARRPGDAVHRDDPREPAGRAPARWPRSCASRRSRRGIRAAPAGAARRHRAAAQRADAIAFTRVPPPHSAPIRRGRRYADHRRVRSRTRRPSRSTTSAVLSRLLRRLQRASSRCVGDFDEAEIAELATELFGGWKTPRPVHARADGFKDVAPSNQSSRDARQGQRHSSSPGSNLGSATTMRTIRRSCSATTCSAAAS